MHTFDDGSPVFIVYIPLQKNLKQFLITVKEIIRLSDSDSLTIFMQRMLEIDCNIIQNTVLYHPFDHCVISPIGIQFDHESHVLDLLCEVVEIWI
jgi:hypothetical protein